MKPAAIVTLSRSKPEKNKLDTILAGKLVEFQQSRRSREDTVIFRPSRPLNVSV